MYFDYFYYKHKYDDLSNFNNNLLYKHFIYYGQKELREPFHLDSVDKERYLKDNQLESNIEIKKHIILNFNENMNIKFKNNNLKSIFNIDNTSDIKFKWNEYILLNDDLKHIKQEYYAIHHFINNGFKEKRLFCNPNKKFSLKYKQNTDKQNTDKQNTDKQNTGKFNNIIDMWQNYIYHEFFNKCNFDWNYYINKNLDLNHIKTKDGAIIHYHNFGIYENRDVKYIKESNNYEPESTRTSIDNEPESTRTTIDTKPESTRTTIDNEPESTRTTIDNEPESTRTTIDNKPESTRTTIDNEPESTRTTINITDFQDKVFDYKYYTSKYDDLKKLNNYNLASKHYLNWGKNENRLINYGQELQSVGHKYLYKTAVIYVYYNRPGEYRNETNLAYFVKKCTLEKKDSIFYLFIINNYNTEVNIPKQDNVEIIKNENCMDFESYLIGIRYLENKFKKNIDKLFNYVVFMNCGVVGPFNNSESWLEPFYLKLKNTKSIICSNILTYLKKCAVPEGPSVPGYLFMVISNYVHLLIKPHNFLFHKLSNTVLGKKKDKLDCILSGEHAISIVAFNNNFNICSLVNPEVDYTDKKNWKLLKFGADRDINFTWSLSKSIFIKNNWRIDEKTRDSYAVRWVETKNLMCENMNMKYLNYNNLDYSNLKINNTGSILLNKTKWSSIHEFYKYFGESEEFILFPYSKKSKKIIYLHNNDKIQRYTIEGIKALLYLNYSIDIYTNCVNNFTQLNVPCNFFKLDNYKELINNSLVLDDSQIFPCCNIELFSLELNCGRFNKSVKNINTTDSNEYINFLKFYL